MPSVDVLIVGGGPSGMAAALCLSRNCYTSAVFDSGVYRNAEVPRLHMFPTWDHKDPKEYRDAARAELQERYSDFVQFVPRKVVDLEKTGDGGFQAEDATGEKWVGKKVILCVGVKDVLPNIPGYDECWVKGIFHCLFCHGYEDRGQESVGVLAIELMAQVPPITNGLIRSAMRLSKKVVVYTNGAEEVAAKLQPMTDPLGDAVTYDHRKIASLVKEPTASQVTIMFDDGSSATEGFLVHGPRNEMDLSFAKKLNLEIAPPLNGELKVTQPFNETTEPGVFAGGDCSSMGKILVASVAFGTFSATGVIRQLQGL